MKVTNIKKLWIKFIRGGLINFPHENLREIEIDGDGLDGGGGGQEETDEVKTYLDELSDKIKSSGSYDEYEMILMGLVSKEEYIADPLPEEMINTFIEQGKVKGDTNNFDYVYAEFNGDESEMPSTFVFITEEQFNYFQKQLINISTKDFIISSLMIDNLEQVFGGIDLSGENAVKNQLAIDKEDFKFALGLQKQEITYYVSDDIDLSYFKRNRQKILILFGENETRKIFDAKITPLKDNDPSNKFSYLEFATLSRYFIESTIQIGNKNYKYLKYNPNPLG